MTTAVLARNEWIKTSRRLAFWVTLGSMGGLMGIMFFDRYSSGLSEKVPDFALPSAWRYIVGEPGPLPAMFAAILMILLVASEFSWRTARQNVIDGLSRAQFYAGKTLLLPAVVLATSFVVLAIGAGFALRGTDFGAVDGALIGPNDLAMIGGQLLSIGGMAALALLIASVVRSSGPAMALYFFYIAFVEQILAPLLVKVVPAAAPLMSYLPASLFMGLTNDVHYYPAAQQAAVAKALEAGKEAPTFVAPELLAAVAAGWMVLFVLVGFVAFRRRDL